MQNSTLKKSLLAVVLTIMAGIIAQLELSLQPR